MRSYSTLSKRLPGHWLHTVEAGVGPTVLFLHGGAGSHRNFRQQMLHLAGDFRVVAYDQRGHGRSPWPGPSTVEDFYQDLLEITDNLPARFSLVAHSFGGCLAARFAAQHPDRVERLALLNTAGHLPEGMTFRLLQDLAGCADPIHHLFPQVIGTGSAVSRHLTRATLRGWNCWSCYPRIQSPTLLVLGRHDPLIPLDLGLQVAGHVPDCDLQVLSPGGHVSMWERPSHLNRWLRGLLARRGRQVRSGPPGTVQEISTGLAELRGTV